MRGAGRLCRERPESFLVPREGSALSKLARRVANRSHRTGPNLEMWSISTEYASVELTSEKRRPDLPTRVFDNGLFYGPRILTGGRLKTLDVAL